MRRPRALMIAPAMPALGGNGLAMRLGLFLEALASIADTDLVVLPIAGRAHAPATLPERLGVPVRIVPVAGRADTLLTLIARLADAEVRRAAFRAYGRPSLAAFVSLPVLAELREATSDERYDLVHAGRLYLAEAALAIGGDPRRTLDLDEDDAAAQRGLAALRRRQRRGSEADWALAEARAFESLAARVVPRFDAAFAAGIWPGSETVPNAVSIERPSRRRDDGRTLLFVGALGYAPNVDGLLWFADRVWPAVRRGRPAARLLIVGADAPPEIRALGARAGITVRGPVAGLEPLYRTAALAIAPLRIGGGTRIKLIEAAARRTPFVATRTAADGLALDARCGWIADDAPAFAGAVLDALSDPAERRRRADRAHRAVRYRHERGRVIAALTRRLATLLPADDATRRDEEGRGRDD